MKRKLVVFSGSGLDYLKDNGEVNIATFRIINLFIAEGLYKYQVIIKINRLII